MIGLASDLLDVFGGFIPILGDVLDLGTAAVMYLVSGSPMALAGLVEIAPFIDFLPSWTVVGILCDMTAKTKTGRRLKRKTKKR